MTTSEKPPIKKRRVWPVAVILCVLVVLVVSYVTSVRGARKHAEQGNGGLRVPEELLNFGEVWADRSFQWRLKVQNGSDSEIDVSNIVTDCYCSSVQPSSFIVPAREAVDLHLMLDLTPRGSSDGIPGWRDFATRIRPILRRGQPNQHGWELRGRVHSAFEISSRQLRFEGTDQLTRGTRFASKSVSVRGHLPLSAVLAQIDSDMGTATVRRREGPSEFVVDVVPSELLPVGKFNFDVVIRSVTTTGQKLPAIDVFVSGSVAPEIQAFPSAVQFGARPVGTTAEERLTLKSMSGIEFTVLSTVTDSENLSLEPTQVFSKSSQHTFRVSYHFKEAGEAKRDLKFRVRDENDQLHHVLVQVTGYAFELGSASGDVNLRGR